MLPYRAVDLETAEAVEHLSEGIASLESSSRTEFSSPRTEISSLRTEIRDGLAEVRRQGLLLHETLREDIQFIAEAVAAMAVKIDSPRQ